MRQVPEYDLTNPSTWVVIEKRKVISESEESAFQKELVRIAGLNPHNEPNLVLRWGATYTDPMLLDGMPKYYLATPDPVLVGHQYRDDSDEMCTVKSLLEVPAHKISLPIYSTTHLGERRFVVERWRSPEFLKATGRYQQTSDNGQTLTYFQCRNCGERVIPIQGTVNQDIERYCPSCHSKRISPVDIREEGEGQLLRSLPREGCYDLFMRLEWDDTKTFRPADARALADIGQQWEWQQKSASERTSTVREAARKAAANIRQRQREIWHPDNLMQKQETI